MFLIWLLSYGIWKKSFVNIDFFTNDCFDDISNKLLQIINSKIFTKYKLKKVNNLGQIERLNEFVRLKTRTLSVISKKKWDTYL